MATGQMQKMSIIGAILLALAAIFVPKVLNNVNVGHGSVIVPDTNAGLPHNVTSHVCLVMIMKDEADNFPKLLPSVREHVSGIIACDTGSTDATVPTLTDFMNNEGIPGIIAHHKWKNFAHNRNLCLKAASEWSVKQLRPCQYWLLMDADQEIVADDDVRLRDLDLSANAYGIGERAKNLYIYHLRLVSTSLDWKYFGAVHEYIGRSDGVHEHGAKISGFRMLHYPSYDRGWEKDAIMLEEALKETPDDARSHFYLGNTYFNMKEYEKALQHYIRRIELEGWEEEQFMAAINVADIAMAQMNNNDTGGISPVIKDRLRSWLTEGDMEDVFYVINAYIAAHTLLPYRAEPFYYVAKLYRTELEAHEECYNYALMAHALGDHKHNSLFPSYFVYHYGILDELCVCAWYAEKFIEGQEACQLLEDRLRDAKSAGEFGSAEAVLLERTLSNKGYYTNKLEEDKLHEFTRRISNLKTHLASTNTWRLTRSGGCLSMGQRGIVISAGGEALLLNAFINMHVLRYLLKSKLPIVVTYWGAFEKDEVSAATIEFIEKHIGDVTFLDVSTLPYPSHQSLLFHPERPNFDGWKVKAFSVYAAPFSEMLFLDCDSMPMLDPAVLFDLPQYKEHGNLFWPDPMCHAPRLYNKMTGLNNPWVANPHYRQAESGQFLINLDIHRDVLEWILFLNTQDEFTYSVSWGDKDLFRVAFDLAGKVNEYQQVDQGPSIPLVILPESSTPEYEDYESRGYIQHHPNGTALFLHRIRGTKYFLGNEAGVDRSFSKLVLSPSCTWCADKWRFVGAPTLKGDQTLDSEEVFLYGPANCTYDFVDIPAAIKNCDVQYDFENGFERRLPVVFEVLPEHHVAQAQAAADAAYQIYVKHHYLSGADGNTT